MSQQELLRHIVETLESAEIPYMLTGSTVSSLQGQPRSTQDIDVVVDLDPSKISAINEAFPAPQFYVQESAMRDALLAHSMFNILDNEGGDKVDFWVLSAEPFDQSSFRRRQQEVGAGISMYVSQPEDTILAKLRWAKLSGGSEKQLGDCIAVYEVNFPELDTDYLKRWSLELGVEELLARVQREADI